MTGDERDKYVADKIKEGKCPFGCLQKGQSMAHCPLGFPGCGCADELMENPYLASVISPIIDVLSEQTRKTE